MAILPMVLDAGVIRWGIDCDNCRIPVEVGYMLTVLATKTNARRRMTLSCLFT